MAPPSRVRCMSAATFPHRRKLFLFVLLNVVDLVLTWCLVGRGNGEVYESNPIARWWLRSANASCSCWADRGSTSASR